jgi:hypothetical protein
MKTALKLGIDAPVDMSLGIRAAVNNCSRLNYVSNLIVMEAASDCNSDDMLLEMVTYYIIIIIIISSSSSSGGSNSSSSSNNDKDNNKNNNNANYTIAILDANFTRRHKLHHPFNL